MATTKIQWADAVWNPVRGCSRCSPGCGGGTPGPNKGGCYAERQAMRMGGPGGAYWGLVESTKAGPRWTGKVRLIPEKLAEPLSWRAPRSVFVNSMSDLFHERLSNEDIAAIAGVMAAAPTHQFLTLTKRSERMKEWFAWLANIQNENGTWPLTVDVLERHARALGVEARAPEVDWPLRQWWLGVSVEDKARRDRIGHLRASPAAIRFLSCEPLLEDLGALNLRGIHWVIVGGESGPGARPCRLEWIDSIRDQCRASGVPFFCKQMGGRLEAIGEHPPPGMAREESGRLFWKFRNKKGGDPSEWPGGLEKYPREMPSLEAAR